jgi:hypothetical protein
MAHGGRLPVADVVLEMAALTGAGKKERGGLGVGDGRGIEESMKGEGKGWWAAWKEQEEWGRGRESTWKRMVAVMEVMEGQVGWRTLVWKWAVPGNRR